MDKRTILKANSTCGNSEITDFVSDGRLLIRNLKKGIQGLIISWKQQTGIFLGGQFSSKPIHGGFPSLYNSNKTIKIMFYQYTVIQHLNHH